MRLAWTKRVRRPNCSSNGLEDFYAQEFAGVVAKFFDRAFEFLRRAVEIVVNRGRSQQGACIHGVHLLDESVQLAGPGLITGIGAEYFGAVQVGDGAP